MSERGQATVEYTVVVVLVAGLLAIVGTTVVAAPGIANSVGRGVRHALCVVTGETCATVDPDPCVVRTTALQAGVTAKVAIVRIGRDAALLRSERSDGTIDLTLLQRTRAGLEVGLGARGRIELGTTALAAGGMLEADVVARLGGGRSWRVRGPAAAAALSKRIAEVLAGRTVSSLPGIGRALDLAQRVAGRGSHRELPPADVESLDAGLSVGVSGAFAGLLDAHLSAGLVVGRRRVRATGETTWLLHVDGDAGTALGEVAGTASARGGAGVAVAVSRDGQPLTLTVSATGGLSHHLGAGGIAQDEGVEAQGSAVLDLTDAANAAIARRVLTALRPRHLGELGPAVAALASAVARDGGLDVATYRTGRHAYGAEGEAAAGAKLGLAAELSRATSKLIGAWTRPPGGAWARRLDCG